MAILRQFLPTPELFTSWFTKIFDFDQEAAFPLPRNNWQATDCSFAAAAESLWDRCSYLTPSDREWVVAKPSNSVEALIAHRKCMADELNRFLHGDRYTIYPLTPSDEDDTIFVHIDPNLIPSLRELIGLLNERSNPKICRTLRRSPSLAESIIFERPPTSVGYTTLHVLLFQNNIPLLKKYLDEGVINVLDIPRVLRFATQRKRFDLGTYIMKKIIPTLASNDVCWEYLAFLTPEDLDGIGLPDRLPEACFINMGALNNVALFSYLDDLKKPALDKELLSTKAVGSSSKEMVRYLMEEKYRDLISCEEVLKCKYGEVTRSNISLLEWSCHHKDGAMTDLLLELRPELRSAMADYDNYLTEIMAHPINVEIFQKWMDEGLGFSGKAFVKTSKVNWALAQKMLERQPALINDYEVVAELLKAGLNYENPAIWDFCLEKCFTPAFKALLAPYELYPADIVRQAFRKGKGWTEHAKRLMEKEELKGTKRMLKAIIRGGDTAMLDEAMENWDIDDKEVFLQEKGFSYIETLETLFYIEERIHAKIPEQELKRLYSRLFKTAIAQSNWGLAKRCQLHLSHKEQQTCLQDKDSLSSLPDDLSFYVRMVAWLQQPVNDEPAFEQALDGFDAYFDDQEPVEISELLSAFVG